MDLRRLGAETLQRVAPSGSTLSRAHWRLLGITASVGMALWLTGLLFIGSRWLPGSFGLFLLTYCGVVAAGSLPDKWISRRLDAVLDRWVRDKTGGGFYGMVALSVFVGLEARALFDPRDGLLSGWSFVEGQVLQYIIGFSVDSLNNMIMAMAWPWPMISRVGVLWTAIFVAACWGAFSLGRALLPMPDLVKKAKPEKSGKKVQEPDDPS